MSAISTFLNQIKTAIYGEQVRDAIHDSILQCYTDVTNGVTLAQNAASSAGRAATDANGAANSATAAAHNASTAASSANTAASTATAAANNASNAKEAANAAAQVATSAANQANDAATAANTAAQAANTAKTNADTATTAANTAAQAANTAATNANTAKDDAVAATEAVNAAAETINEKAIKSGTEPDLTAGTAEQLVSDETVLDTEPYKLRKTAGPGNRAYLDKIIGGTVCWNQLVKNGDFVPGGGNWYAPSCDLTLSDGSCTLKLLQTTGAPRLEQNLDTIANHVYVLMTALTPPKDVLCLFTTDTGAEFFNKIVPANQKTSVTRLIKIPNDKAGTKLRLYVNRNSVLVEEDVVTFYKTSLFDITQMFGSTIADYVYNLEQANAGAGVKWFRKIFPAEYYPYNAGELISVSGLSEHKTTGFNIWDEEWLNGYYSNTGSFTSASNQICTKNMIPVLPNTAYCITVPLIGTDRIDVSEYDSNGAFLRRAFAGYVSPSGRKIVYTTSSDTHFININFSASYGTTYKNDICINLSDPSRNGTYEPYEKHSYPLDSSLALRGIPKLDSENKLYYNGDEYTPDGKVKRKYGIVDLGTLTWETRDTGNTNKLLSSRLPAEYISKTGVFNWVSDRYSNNGYSAAAYIIGDVDNVNTGLYLYWAGENATSKAVYVVLPTQETKPSGYLIYELATPTEESAEPYAQVQVIDPAGTEKFVSESILPVGHETRYMADLKDRLEHLPDPAANDGLYAIQQTDGKMELVNATFSPGVVENASGAIASFSDGADNVPVKNLVVNIEPVQDLHGYDSPWPAGGGKNKFDRNLLIDSTSAVFLNLQLESGKTYTFSTDYQTTSFEIQATNTDLQSAQSVYANHPVTFTMSGDGVLTIRYYKSSGASAMNSYNWQLEEGSSATTYSPYSNICPISGWTGVKVSRTGINIWDEEWEEGTFNTITGVNIGIHNQLRSKNIIKIKPNTTYFWNSPVYNWIIFYDKYGNVIEKPVVTDSGSSSKSGNAISVSAMHVFTTPANAYGARFYTGTYNVPYKNNIGINYPSTDTDYHPGHAKTYDISLPSEAGTVYGGTLDVATGELTVDRAMVTLDGTETWTKPDNCFYTTKYKSESDYPLGVSSHYKVGRIYGGVNGVNMRIGIAKAGLRIHDENYGSSITDFVAGLAPSPVTLVYKLDTPLTYQLTPTHVKTILGQNNIFADTGDVNVDYIADTKLYIDKKFTELQALVLENVGG